MEIELDARCTAPTGSGTYSSPVRGPAGCTRGAPTVPTSRPRVCASTHSASCSTRGPGSSAMRFGIARQLSTATPRRRCAPRSSRPTTTTGRATQPLRRSLQDAVIYELHVGGFTRHPSAGVAAPGTFRGLIDKIPYLQALGITDVELLPVFAFDTAGRAGRRRPPSACTIFGATAPCGFFAPHRAYAAGADPRREFRDMVKALHARRHRRDPRRRAESHGRRRRGRAHDRLQRARQRALLSARPEGPDANISTSRAAATR